VDEIDADENGESLIDRKLSSSRQNDRLALDEIRPRLLFLILDPHRAGPRELTVGLFDADVVALQRTL